MTVDLLDRLAKYTDTSGDCWEWTAFVKPNGYGQINQNDYAHRVMYEAVVEPIAEGMVIDHLCMNKKCVNLDHLEVVTQAENNRRSASHRASLRTHCKWGHEFTPENTIIHWKSGGRNCRQCKREQRMRRYFEGRGVAVPAKWSRTPQTQPVESDGGE